MSSKEASSASEIAKKVMSKVRGAGQAVGTAAKDVGRGASQAARGIGGGGSASIPEVVGATAGKGARSAVQAAKAHPYAAAGIGAGVLGTGAATAALASKNKKEKTASEIADVVLTKVGFSVTEAGHEFDAARAGAKKDYYIQLARALQEQGALPHGTSGGKTESNLPILRAYRFGSGYPGGHPVTKARHQAYVEKKHREGKNAWNPLGGLLTPLEQEMEGTEGGFTYRGLGKLKPEEEAAAAPAAQKAASEIADAVLTKIATSTDPISDNEKEVIRWFTGPIHAAIRAPEGKKIDAFRTVYQPATIGALKGFGIGSAGGIAGGAGLGALASLLTKGRYHPAQGALAGALGGGALGGLTGGVVGKWRGLGKGLDELQRQSQDWASEE